MWFLKRRKLDDVLVQTKRVKIEGVIFQIRKINVLDFCEGSQALRKAFDTYKTAKEQTPEQAITSTKKLKKHYADVFLAGVVEPKLSRENDGTGIFVENLFTEWELVERLYEEIYTFTYGKKKVR